MNIDDLPGELFDKLAGCCQSHFINKSFYNNDIKYIIKLYKTLKSYDNDTNTIHNLKSITLICYWLYDSDKSHYIINNIRKLILLPYYMISCLYKMYLINIIKYNNISLLQFNLNNILFINYSNNHLRWEWTITNVCSIMIHNSLHNSNKKILQLCVNHDLFNNGTLFILYNKNDHNKSGDKSFNYIHNCVFIECFSDCSLKHFNWLHKHFSPPLNNKCFYTLINNKIVGKHKLNWLYEKGYYLPAHIKAMIYFKKLIYRCIE